jgi:hypothetical protein
MVLNNKLTRVDSVTKNTVAFVGRTDYIGDHATRVETHTDIHVALTGIVLVDKNGISLIHQVDRIFGNLLYMSSMLVSFHLFRQGTQTRG